MYCWPGFAASLRRVPYQWAGKQFRLVPILSHDPPPLWAESAWHGLAVTMHQCKWAVAFLLLLCWEHWEGSQFNQVQCGKSEELGNGHPCGVQYHIITPHALPIENGLIVEDRFIGSARPAPSPTGTQAMLISIRLHTGKESTFSPRAVTYESI